MKKYLLIIILISAVLRLTNLSLNPPSLNWDEVSHGYNAYSILKTGKDEWGDLLPVLNFRAYGDYPLTLNMYLTIPFIVIFGLNEVSIRLPHAILGVLTVVSSYYLFWGITRKKSLSLLGAFLVAIEPWYLFTSRFVLQANLSIFLITSGFAFFFNRDKDVRLLPLSFVFFILGLFSYHTARIFLPIIVLLILIIFREELLKVETRVKTKLFLLIGLFYLLTVVIFLNPYSRARGNFVFLLDSTTSFKVIELRNASKLPNELARLLYNRPTYFVSEFSKRYFSYFSPQFLFFKGGTQYQFSVPNQGLMYVVNLPLFYLGIYLLVKKVLKKDLNSILILSWLIISPIPASLTSEYNAVVRATTMLPLPQLLVILGAAELVSLAKKKGILTYAKAFYFVALLILIENYLSTYYTDYRKNYSWSWQYGYKEAVNYVKENYDNYAKIVVTKKYGEPHEFFLFYWPWDPGRYQEDPKLVRFYQSGWYWVDGFDKFYFVNDWQIKDAENRTTFTLESGGKVDCKNPKCLLITSPGNYPDGWKKVETINFLDGRPAFELYDNQQN